MHPATEFQLQFFQTEHLHPLLQPVVSQFRTLATSVATGPENPETTRAVSLLVQAKDAAVRAIVATGALNEVVVTPAPTDPDRCPRRLGNMRGLQCLREPGHTGADKFAVAT